MQKYGVLVKKEAIYLTTMKIHSIFVNQLLNNQNQVEKEALNEKLEELIELLRNLNNSKHNYSLQLEMFIRDYFDILIDEIKN